MTTPQKRTSLALLAAFNALDIDAILSHRSPGCMRHILPSSLNIAPTNNTEYAQQLQRLFPLFSNFELTLQDCVEDVPGCKVVLWLKARADTLVGEYVNEYMWTLDFDETGERIMRVHEFVDSAVQRDFWPKLEGALRELRRARLAEGE
jgi:ketosteroid isomerase-like protein